jgi:hypothetical protein
MNFLRGLVVLTGLVAAGCSTVQPVPGHPDAVPLIERYYEDNAWEEGARCVRPSIDVTEVNVVENTPDRLVVDTRYYWRDDRADTDTYGNTCNGFGSRRFTISGGRVVAMTGEQR